MTQGANASTPVLRSNGRDVTLGELLTAMKRSDGFASLRAALQQAAAEQIARDRRLAVTDAELQQAADAFRRQRGLHDARLTQQWLDQAGLAVSDLEQMLESRLLRQKLAADVITAEHVHAYFAEHESALDRAEISEILTHDAALAEQIASDLQEAEAAFMQIAADHARDEPTCHAGGYIGWVGRRQLAPVLEARVFTAGPGEITDPVQTEAGWHILKIWQLRPAALDAATEDEIRDRLFSQWLDQHASTGRVQSLL